VKTLRLLTKSVSGPLHFACDGVWYVFNAVGDEVEVPESLAEMLLAPKYLFGTFKDVTP